MGAAAYRLAGSAREFRCGGGEGKGGGGCTYLPARMVPRRLALVCDNMDMGLVALCPSLPAVTPPPHFPTSPCLSSCPLCSCPSDAEENAALYNMACAYAQMGRKAGALTCIEAILGEG